MYDWPEDFATFEEIQKAFEQDARQGEQYSPFTKDQEGYVQRAVTINRPLAEVYKFWRRLSNFPLFMKYVVSVDEVDDKYSNWIIKRPAGVEVQWAADIVEEIPDELLSWRSLPSGDISNHGDARFNESPHGTEVRLKFRYNAPGGKLTDKLMHLFDGDPAEQARENMCRFKQLLEAGVIATIDGQSKGKKL
ncbi:MAG: SRPBCC family protein [Sumerlaeia bacterium]